MTTIKEKYEDMYKNLTIEDKISLLKYERGAIALVHLEHYEDSRANPSPSPRPNYLYISNVLDLDFGEFYNSKLASKSFDYKDQMQNIGIGLSDTFHSTFIGDILMDIVHRMCHPENLDIIDKDLVNKIDTELKKAYDDFIALVDPKPKYSYEETKFCVMTYNGYEKLYRRLGDK